MIRSAAVNAISVTMLNEEIVSIKLVSLIPRRSPIFWMKVLNDWVVIRHEFTDEEAEFELLLISRALLNKSNDLSPQRR